MFTYLIKKTIGTKNDRELKRLRLQSERVNALEPQVARLSDAGLRAMTSEFKRRLSDGAMLDDLLPEAFAVVREAAWRVLGMRHFDVQLMGGIVLHQGKIAEMKTGEGKTLVATAAVYLNSLAGRGVHMVTVNDYLARRDAQWMGSVYRFLGLTVGAIQHDMPDPERRQAYACDVTFGTNNEYGFDYLRDNMKPDLAYFVQRGHHYAIVDEVDSILIDEARTPLIISGPAEESTELYYKINQIIPRLKAEEDFKVEEKTRSVVLTEAGVAVAEKLIGVENLYDPNNVELLHHVNQALKAHALFKRDVDYVVKNGQVIIVDEFTGRLMEGRRYSEGLHQALEAKERVKVENENQTLATITFQNFFRLYDKLAGMTGTADTEAAEFAHTYKLDVVVIPTNRSLIRINFTDVVYQTAEEKYKAVVREIQRYHARRQPVLVGTISIENSELLSTLLRREKIPHHVLNAKHHEHEAEIVAQAGQPGAVTISTNMAGRGTDIILGPGVVRCPRNSNGRILCCLDCREDCQSCPKPQKRIDFQACFEEVPCGLHVLGTERHESRRIDNQLRGRSGRQGDPGSSRFFLSLEDDLMRIFATEWVQRMLERLKIPKDEPIEHKMVAKQIENAQRRVEQNNFSARKRLLEYDDVMNKQREIFYGQRMDALQGFNLRELIRDWTEEVAGDLIDEHLPAGSHPDDWELGPLATAIRNSVNLAELPAPDEELRAMEPSEILDRLLRQVEAGYGTKVEEFGEGVMRSFEAGILLHRMDELWKDHLLNMDHLKEGIWTRGYGQRDPLTEYKVEGFELFQDMIQALKKDVVKYALFYQPKVMETRARTPRTQHLHRPEAPRPRSAAGEIPAAAQGGGKPQTYRRSDIKVGRNDPCPCGSGKKYKKCCGR